MEVLLVSDCLFNCFDFFFVLQIQKLFEFNSVLLCSFLYTPCSFLEATTSRFTHFSFVGFIETNQECGWADVRFEKNVDETEQKHIMSGAHG
jgi:hypothetical protein